MFLHTKYTLVISTFMYTNGFYAFQSVLVATCYSISSYFISGFGEGYMSIMYVILTCIFLLTVFNHFTSLNTCRYFHTTFFLSYYALYHIMYCYY